MFVVSGTLAVELREEGLAIGDKRSALGSPAPMEMQTTRVSYQGECNDAIFFRQGLAEQADGFNSFNGLVKLNEGQVAFRRQKGFFHSSCLVGSKLDQYVSLVWRLSLGSC